MITAMDLSDAGHDVEIFEARPFMGGKASDQGRTCEGFPSAALTAPSCAGDRPE